MQRFGEKLRILRVHNGMSLTNLAQAVGLTSRSYISELESGRKKPTSEFVLSVARLFNVTTDELMKDELDLSIDDENQHKKG
jgi:transcriptional regulator with XRE-family HTH domain